MISLIIFLILLLSTNSQSYQEILLSTKEIILSLMNPYLLMLSRILTILIPLRKIPIGIPLRSFIGIPLEIPIGYCIGFSDYSNRNFQWFLIGFPKGIPIES